MPGLLTDQLTPEVLSLLGGATPSGGLFGNQSPGRYQPMPNEGWSDRLFGTRDPRDPRGPAMSALAVGLLRGDFASGLENANKAIYDTEDRAFRRQGQNVAMAKDALGLQQLFDTTGRTRNIRKELQELDRSGQLPQPAGAPAPYPVSGPAQAENFGAPSLGGIPMFSQIGQGEGGQQGQVPQSRGGVPAWAAGAVEGRGAPQQPYQQPQQPQQDLAEGYSARLIQQAQVYSRNGDFETANKLLESATKLRPEVSRIEVAIDPRTKQPVNVITYKSGRQEVSQFGAPPKVHWADTGDKIQPVNEYTLGNLGPGLPKRMTPSEAGNLRVAQGNLNLSRQRLALDENSPQYLQTEGGLVALPKRPQPGAPLIGQPVNGPDGQQLGPQLKAIPANANTAIVTNMQNLSKAQQALALLKGGQVGTSQGDTAATGVKGYLPNGMLNRMDPAGVDTRASISDLGSMIIHDRSGAAVTAAESPRLGPFVPLATDDRATAEKKLQRFISVYQQETDALAQTYSKEQGYRENPILKRNAGNTNDTLPGALPLPAKPTAVTLKRGQTYQLPNGAAAEWDGFQFKTKGK
jgi:hypothetical protein